MNTFIENLYKKLLIILVGMVCFLIGLYFGVKNGTIVAYFVIALGLCYAMIFFCFKKSLYALDSDLKAFEVAASDLTSELKQVSKGILVNDDLLLKHGMFTFSGVYHLDVEKVYEANGKYLIKKYTGGYQVYPVCAGVKDFVNGKLVDEDIPEEGLRKLK